MKNQIKQAEMYARSLINDSAEEKELKLNKKFGMFLSKETIKYISKNFQIMITAKELRSGVSKLYYLSSEGDELICNIDRQDIEWIERDTKGFNLVHRPIPLTEEILLKCGFEKTDDYGDIIYYELKNRGRRSYYICFDHDDISFGLSLYGACTSLIYDSENLQYLHHLQNLFYSISGKEIDVNL